MRFTKLRETFLAQPKTKLRAYCKRCCYKKYYGGKMSYLEKLGASLWDAIYMKQPSKKPRGL